MCALPFIAFPRGVLQQCGRLFPRIVKVTHLQPYHRQDFHFPARKVGGHLLCVVLAASLWFDVWVDLLGPERCKSVLSKSLLQIICIFFFFFLYQKVPKIGFWGCADSRQAENACRPIGLIQKGWQFSYIQILPIYYKWIYVVIFGVKGRVFLWMWLVKVVRALGVGVVCRFQLEVGGGNERLNVTQLGILIQHHSCCRGNHVR